jgi:hypothetical protein
LKATYRMPDFAAKKLFTWLPVKKLLATDSSLRKSAAGSR